MNGMDQTSFTPIAAQNDILSAQLRMIQSGFYQNHNNGGSEQSLQGDHSRLNKKHGSIKSSLPQQREVNLAKMGFNRDTPVDWSIIRLPEKSELHRLLHHKITNYINPDIFVSIGNHEYRCHLLVLQCYSNFFNEKFDTHIELPESKVSKNAFSFIYDWMLYCRGDSYTLLRRETVLEIFMAAQYLQIKELDEQCWAFIDNEEFFSEDTAFMLYLDARALRNAAVMELMVPRIQRFFLTLVASKDFLDLVVEEVSVFLQSNYICIHCEMEVFMSAVRWLMFDWEKRHKYLVELMSCIRFGLISPWQLVDIRRNPDNPEFLIVTSHPEVSKMIEDGLAFATVKYWHEETPSEYAHWIETLGLCEPVPRNWAGPSKVNDQKKYNTYQEFLGELIKYQEIQIATHRGSGDVHPTCSSSVESQHSEDFSLDQAAKDIDTGAFIIPFNRR